MDELAEREPRRWLRSLIVNALVFIGIMFVGFAVLLYVFQDRLIYYPRRYLGDAPGENWELLRSQTSFGWQTAFLARAGNGPVYAGFVPDQLWIVFSGNAATASEWEDFVQHYPDSQTAFLLVDYPGYGFSQGKPAPETIAVAARGAYDRMREKLGSGATAHLPIGLLGHSLGAAAGLELLQSISEPAQRIVLIAPFTSMSGMARRAVGWPLSLLLRHNFDNAARLRQLLERQPKPMITIFHGSNDEVIPVEMGRELARQFPAAKFVEIPGEMHNSIVQNAREVIVQAMMSPLPPS